MTKNRKIKLEFSIERESGKPKPESWIAAALITRLMDALDDEPIYVDGAVYLIDSIGLP